MVKDASIFFGELRVKQFNIIISVQDDYSVVFSK